MDPGKSKENTFFPFKCDQIVDILGSLYWNMIKDMI